MRLKSPWLAATILLAAALPGRALPWGRTRVPAAWPAAAVQVDGGEAKWSGAEEVDQSPLTLRALSDASRLFLRLSADGPEGRALLTGTYRQDLTLWFLDAKGKSRTWGILLPFSSLGPPSPEAAQHVREAPTGIPSIEVQLALPRRVDVSTAALPQDIQIQAFFEHRDPVFELAVPLARLAGAGSRAVSLDVVSSPVAASIQHLLKTASAGAEASASADAAASGKALESGRKRAAQLRPLEFPEPLDLSFSVRLASEPDEPR